MYRPRFLAIEGFPDYDVGTDGSVWSWKTGKAVKLKPTLTMYGYLTVRLCGGGKPVTKFVHHFVLEAFVGPRPTGKECCHNDGVKTNNRLENLRWDTRHNNEADKKKHGTDNTGERHGMVKLTEEEVREIKLLLSLGWTQQRIARQFNMARMTINRIKMGSLWKHVV